MPQNVIPFEIIAAPFTVYKAPVGEPFPVIDAAPAGNWVKLGASGDRNLTEEGVTVGHTQAFNLARPAGATGPVKAVRTEEDLVIRLTLWDLRLEMYSYALNDNAVATTAAGSGTAGFKQIAIHRGVQVATFALLIRGDISPYGADWKSQYQVPYAYAGGNPEPVYAKNFTGLAFEFMALEDPNAATEADRFGHLIQQHQTALP